LSSCATKLTLATEASLASKAATETTTPAIEASAESTPESAITESARTHRSGWHGPGVASAAETTTEATGLPALHGATTFNIYLDTTVLDPDTIATI